MLVSEAVEHADEHVGVVLLPEGLDEGVCLGAHTVNIIWQNAKVVSEKMKAPFQHLVGGIEDKNPKARIVTQQAAEPLLEVPFQLPGGLVGSGGHLIETRGVEKHRRVIQHKNHRNLGVGGEVEAREAFLAREDGVLATPRDPQRENQEKQPYRPRVKTLPPARAETGRRPGEAASALVHFTTAPPGAASCMILSSSAM
jgi:hypothetical protein